MALDDDLDACAESLIDPLPVGATTEQTAARNAAKAKVKTFCQNLFTYIVANLEIKGVVCGETYSSGFGSNHVPSTAGDMTAPSYLVTGSVVGVQTNDGKGLIE